MPPLALHRLLDCPPMPRTKLLGWEYVFDAETATRIETVQEVASLLEVYLYWREDLARQLAGNATSN